MSKLDRQVAEVLGRGGYFHEGDGTKRFVMEDGFSPSANWEQGGKLIFEHEIGILPLSPASKSWRASVAILKDTTDGLSKWRDIISEVGKTPLIAAMKVLIASKS